MYQLLNGNYDYLPPLKTAFELLTITLSEAISESYSCCEEIKDAQPGFIANIKEHFKRKMIVGALAKVGEGVTEASVGAINPQIAQGAGNAVNGIVRLGAFIYFRMHDQDQKDQLEAAKTLLKRIDCFEQEAKQQQKDNKEAKNITGIDILITRLTAHLRERFIEALEELSERAKILIIRVTHLCRVSFFYKSRLDSC